jgi:hypothetical protein
MGRLHLLSGILKPRQGQVVGIIPSLFPEARRRGLMQPLRVWYLLRSVDQYACGRLTKADALRTLQRLGWSQGSVYRLIGKGMGTFWREETTFPHGKHGSGTKTLVLVGVKVLAVAWGLERLSRHQVEVPWKLCTRDVAAWNALAYHAWLPGPRPLRITRGRAVHKSLPNHPYSRAKIRHETGISERTQIRHQELLLPGTGRKVTRKRANYATYREELKSKRHISWGQKRLGNSYTSNLSRRGWGQAKVFNKDQGGFRPHAHDATGSSLTGRARRFFEMATDLLRAHQRDIPLYPDPMLRISPGSREAPIVVTRRPYVGWWEVLDLSGMAVA